MDKMITYFMNFPLFEDLNKELIFTIVTRSRYLKLSTKETVIAQGETPRLVYFIKSGKLKIVKEIKNRVKTEAASPTSFLKKNRASVSLPQIRQKDATLEMVLEESVLTGGGVSEEVKYLELDELDSGDVFCHNNVIERKPMDHSVVTVLPAELYTLPANDFLLLCKDLLSDFKRYNKPYPSEQQIKLMHNQEKKWVSYKQFLVTQIQVNKKLQKQSFDYILRQNHIKMPKAVRFIPESKIRL